MLKHPKHIAFPSDDTELEFVNVAEYQRRTNSGIVKSKMVVYKYIKAVYLIDTEIEFTPEQFENLLSSGTAKEIIK